MEYINDIYYCCKLCIHMKGDYFESFVIRLSSFVLLSLLRLKKNQIRVLPEMMNGIMQLSRRRSLVCARHCITMKKNQWATGKIWLERNHQHLYNADDILKRLKLNWKIDAPLALKCLIFNGTDGDETEKSRGFRNLDVRLIFIRRPITLLAYWHDSRNIEIRSALELLLAWSLGLYLNHEAASYCQLGFSWHVHLASDQNLITATEAREMLLGSVGRRIHGRRYLWPLRAPSRQIHDSDGAWSAHIEPLRGWSRISYQDIIPHCAYYYFCSISLV